MKLYTCMAHADPKKLPYLTQVLKMQARLADQVHVCIITNITNADDIAAIYRCAPEQTDRFKVEVYNEGCDRLSSPWLLTWVHKKLLLEKFADPEYTHFMCIEDDMEVTPLNFNYWLREREKLRPYNVYPSFLRVEWNYSHQQWAMTDSLEGDCYSISASPRVMLSDEYAYLNLSRPYQGMFLYDRELMQEHIESVSFDLFQYVPDWRKKILRKDWPWGVTEAAVLGLTHINVNPGCFSRNFIPYYVKFGVIDPCCFVHHLPDKYTNMPDSDAGKVLIRDLLCQ